MADDRPGATSDEVSGGGRSRNTYAVLLVGLTVVLCLAAIIFLRPHVSLWLESRSAHRNLSSDDYSARLDAVRWLVRHGENPDPELISLLYHPDENVRMFAANELCTRPSTDEIVEAFLVALETGRYANETVGFAAYVFLKHAEGAGGPMTETDRRIVAVLQPVASSIKDYSLPDRRSAAIVLAAFADRDPSLHVPLAQYRKNRALIHQLPVVRQLARGDESFREEYVELLLSAFSSFDPACETQAIHYLKELREESQDLIPQLKARQQETTDPVLTSQIDRAFEKLDVSDGEQP